MVEVFEQLPAALDINLHPELQTKLLSTFFIIILLSLLRLMAHQLINRRLGDVNLGYRFRKLTSYLAAFLGLLLLGRVWWVGAEVIVTFLGLFSAGLAIALHGPAVNLAGWLYIMLGQPFHVGDRIQIGKHAGGVIDKRIFQFILLEIGNWVDADQSTGRLLHVPNGQIFSEVLANYTGGFDYIWHEIPVRITFESDWAKAKSLLQEIINRHTAHVGQAANKRIQEAARRLPIHYTNLTPTVYTKVVQSGILLTTRFLCNPRTRRGTEQAIWEDILQTFAAQPNIHFAYETHRIIYGSNQQPLSDGHPSEVDMT